MTEHGDERQRDEAPGPPQAPADDQAADPAEGSAGTGHPGVDDVLRSLEGLDERPVEEHVAVFEAAHEMLRAALVHAGDRPADRSGS